MLPGEGTLCRAGMKIHADSKPSTTHVMNPVSIPDHPRAPRVLEGNGSLSPPEYPCDWSEEDKTTRPSQVPSELWRRRQQVPQFALLLLQKTPSDMGFNGTPNSIRSEPEKTPQGSSGQDANFEPQALKGNSPFCESQVSSLPNSVAFIFRK